MFNINAERYRRTIVKNKNKLSFPMLVEVPQAKKIIIIHIELN